MIPLCVSAIEYRGIEYLDTWFNGKKHRIKSPIKPYFYSYKKDLNTNAKVSRVEATALSCNKEKTFYKYEFDTRAELVKARNDFTFEDNIPFVIRNRIDDPNLYIKHPHTNELKFLFLDIEQYCPEDKPFPSYDDIITAISYCTNDREIKTGSLKKETMSDKKLLQWFIKGYEKVNPDVIVVYNKSYDINTILQRCQRNRIDTTHFSKTNKRPFIGGKEGINIDGVVIYDVLESSRADQSLTGNVENKGLKEVSNWFGFEETRAPLTPREMTLLKGTKELKEYNKDDVRRLLLVFDVYWQNIEFNANDLRIPLNSAINLKTSDLGTIVIGDEHRALNIIADGTNAQRYPEIFQRKKKSGEKNYQGALVDIFVEPDWFEPVYKIDYSSLYPSIMATFNLSPDTTTLLEYAPYTGKFSMEDRGDWYVYSIPDEVLYYDIDKQIKKTNMIIQVSKKPGFSSTLVAKFLKERAEYKKLWKETDLPKYRAISDNRKVKANGGVYGSMGYSKHPFGFAPIAVATCGIGRECGQLLIDVLNELYPGCVLEIDTDGCYFTVSKELFSKEKIINLYNTKLKEKFEREVALSIDFDEYTGGYFYKAKNYILKKKNGKKILHGVALKASSHTMLKKQLIGELSDAVINREPTDKIVKKYLGLNFPLKYFAMNVALGKRLHEYKSKNTLVKRLAEMAKREYGIKPTVGNQYYYVKTKTDYKLFESASKNDLDYDYYRDDIKSVIDMFAIKNPSSGTLDKWI